MFLWLDTDQDGLLSFDELVVGMRTIAQSFQIEEPDVRAMFSAADITGEGKITYSDFLTAAYPKDILLSDQNLRNVFQIFDTESKGFFTKVELKQVFGE